MAGFTPRGRLSLKTDFNCLSVSTLFKTETSPRQAVNIFM